MFIPQNRVEEKRPLRLRDIRTFPAQLSRADVARAALLPIQLCPHKPNRARANCPSSAAFRTKRERQRGDSSGLSSVSPSFKKMWCDNESRTPDNFNRPQITDGGPLKLPNGCGLLNFIGRELRETKKSCRFFEIQQLRGKAYAFTPLRGSRSARRPGRRASLPAGRSAALAHWRCRGG